MKKSCLNCKSFQQSPNPPHMRGCQFEGKIVMNGASCGCWRDCYGFFVRFKAKLLRRNLPSRSLIL